MSLVHSVSKCQKTAGICFRQKVNAYNKKVPLAFESVQWSLEHSNYDSLFLQLPPHHFPHPIGKAEDFKGMTSLRIGQVLLSVISSTTHCWCPSITNKTTFSLHKHKCKLLWVYRFTMGWKISYLYLYRNKKHEAWRS